MCLSVCVSTFACPSDNSSHVPARITWFGQKDAKHFALGPYCFWSWLSLTFQVKLSFISKFCLRFWNICETYKNGLCWTVPYPTWIRTHADYHICTPTESCQWPWSSLLLYLRETIAVLPALDSAMDSWFYKLLKAFAKLKAPHILKSYITTSAITETTAKQRSFACILFDFRRVWPGLRFRQRHCQRGGKHTCLCTRHT